MSVTRDCSIAAYKWMNESGNASENRKRVYNLFRINGSMTGAIASEKYRSAFPNAGSSEVVRNRISELMRMDAIEVKGTVIDPNTKMTVSVFSVVTDRMPIKFVPKKSKAQLKIDALLAEVESLRSWNEHYKSAIPKGESAIIEENARLKEQLEASMSVGQQYHREMVKYKAELYKTR